MKGSSRIFAPTKQPRLAISYRNEVEPDYGGMIQLTTVDDYKRSVREPTWRAVQKFIKESVDRKLRIAFFSATPQGGGVALMRHALLRFLQMQGVNVEWFVVPLDVAVRLSFANEFVPGLFRNLDQMSSVLPRQITTSCKVWSPRRCEPQTSN